MQQENANMLRAQLSWRSVEVSCEFSNDLGVATGRAFGEVAQPEILLHALARMPSRMRASSVSTFVLWMMRPYLEAQIGSEFLYGISGGRRFAGSNGWAAIAGHEIFGQTAFHQFFSGETGTEALLIGRLEHGGTGRNLRMKLGVGHALVQSFGAAQWRIVFGVELFGHKQIESHHIQLAERPGKRFPLIGTYFRLSQPEGSGGTIASGGA
jgi:hypothetical protein